MVNEQTLTTSIIHRTHRVPAVSAPSGDGAAVAQTDAVLAGAGFKASRQLLEHLSGREPGAAMDTAVQVVGAVRELVGDHVAHQPYFVDFPAGVWLHAPEGVTSIPADGWLRYAAAMDAVSQAHAGKLTRRPGQAIRLDRGDSV
jgi:hypothetical protein